MQSELILYRINAAANYLSALDLSLREGWRKNYQSLDNKRFSENITYIEAMALLHPWHFEEIPEILNLRGARSFSQDIMRGIGECNSEYIWGYKCPFESEILAADHLFPYSLGGCTITENKIYLCRFHNQMKSNDIHLFPWERNTPSWVQAYLERVSFIFKRRYDI